MLTLHALPPGVELPEEDQEAVVRLQANNALPLFWLALAAEADVRGWWEAEVRAALAAPDGDEPLPPLILCWRSAQVQLAAARARAPAMAPELAPALDAWGDALLALARPHAVNRVELDIAEVSNFHGGADGFVAEVLRGVALWHGSSPPALLSLQSPSLELGGFTDAGEPFPPGTPAWMPGLQGLPSKELPPWWNRAWVSVPAGAALVGGSLWLGGLPGAAVALGAYVAFETWAAFRR